MPNLSPFPLFRKQIAFLDPQVKDYALLLKGIESNVEVVILEKDQDGIEQITQYLRTDQENSIESIHLISHGTWGQIHLGSTQLNLESLPYYSQTLQSWSNILSQSAEILLYGCRVAGNAIGRSFVDRLSQLTKRAIAASTTLTGNTALGGTWDLGYRTGETRSKLALDEGAIATYPHTLNADLEITGVTISNNVPNVGNTITYTITLSNNGPDNATGVEITDALPSGLTFSGSTPSQGTYDNTTGIWTVGNINNGNNATLKIKATINSGTSGTILSNTAQITASNQADPNATNNQATANTFVGNIQPNPFYSVSGDPSTLSLVDITNGKQTVIPGGQLAFRTFAITRDSVTGRIYYVGEQTNAASPVGSQVGYWDPETQTKTTLPQRTGVNVQFLKLAQAQDTTIYGLTGNTPNLYSIDPITGAATDLGAISGGTPAFTAGSGDAAFDPNNSNILYVSVVAGGQLRLYQVDITTRAATYAGAAGINNVDNSGSLGFGADGNLYAVIRANSKDSERRFVRFELDATGKVQTVTEILLPSDNSGDFGTLPTPTPDVDFTITKTDGVDNIATGASITYTISLTNNTLPNRVVGLIVQDSIPTSGVDIDSWDAEVTNNSGQSKIINGASGTTNEIFTSLNIGPNDTLTILARGTVIAPAGTPMTPSTIINTVEVPGINDTSKDDDILTDRTNVVATTPPDLSIIKTASSNSVTAGNPLTYTLTVSNATGGASASSIEVADTLPTGFTYSSATVEKGFSASETGGVVTFSGGTLAAGETATLTIIGTVTASATNPFTNTATVDPNNTIAESNESNNQGTVTPTVTIPQPDLSIIKTASSNSVTAGNPLTYTLTVSNATGGASASSIEVADTLPTGFTYSSATVEKGFSASETGGVVTFSGGTLAAGETATLTIIGTVTASATNPFTNTATVDPNNTIAESNESNNQGTVTPTVTIPQPDLSIIKTASSNSVTAGNPLTYTLTVSNATGGASASSIEVADTLPTGFTYSSATVEKGFSASETGGVVTFSGGTLAAGETATLTIIGTVTASATNPFTNTATVDPNNTIAESNESNNQGTVTPTVTIPQPDLSIIKTASSNSVTAGNPLTYTLTVSNATGGASASSIEVADTLPTGFTYSSATVEKGFSASETGGVVTFSGGTLAAGETATLTIIGTVTASATNPFTNTATVDPNNTIAESNESNNQGTVTPTVTIPQPDLSIIKTASSNSVTAGNPLTYTLTVSNATGGASASSIEVADTLPTGFTYSSATVEKGFSASETGGVVTFSGGTLAAGETATLTIIGTVTASATNPFTNTATVDPNNTIAESNESNNQGTVTPTVTIPQPDLSIIKTASSNSVTAGNPLTYTLTVSNATGGASASSIEVADTLPTGFTYSSATVEKGFSASETGGVVTFSGGTLAAGETATLTIIGTVTASATNPFTNTATVDPNNTIAESNESNNQGTVTPTVTIPQPDLSIIKTASSNSVTAGNPLTYTLTVSNATGGASASSIEVADTLPTGFTYSSATVEKGFSASETGGVVTFSGGTLAAGETATLTIIGTVTASATNPFTNTATVDPNNTIAESNESNNQGAVTPTVTIPQPDLSIIKTASSNSVTAGNPLTYTLTVSNATGGASASSIEVADTLPTGFTYSSATVEKGFSASETGGVVTFSGGTLAAGETATLTIIGTVTASATNPFTNTATVDPNNTIAESNESNNQGAVTPTVTIPPVANNDSSTTPQDTNVTFNITGNDTDADGTINSNTVDLDPTTSGIQNTITVPGQGTFTVDNTGQVTFDPEPTFVGTATIPYTVQDNEGNTSNQANISVTVSPTPTPIPPVANNDSSTTPQDTNVTFNITDNDTDADGTINPATVDLDPTTPGIQNTLTVAGQGTFTVDNTGKVTFDPEPTFVGTATIPYTVQDDEGNTSNQANISVTVTSILNNPPEAHDRQSETISNDKPAPVPTLTATDPDAGDTITSFTLTTLPLPAQGVLLLDGNPVTQNQVLTPDQASRLVFNPNPTFTGNATFTYTATDSAGNTDATPATVTLPVQAAVTTAPPEAIDKFGPARPNNEPSPVPTLAATDPDNDVSFFTVTTLPPASQGTLFYNGVPVQAGQTFTPEQAGQLVFNPNPNFVGNATFEYTATDSAGNTDATPATVTLPVQAAVTTAPPEAIDKFGPARPNNEPSPVPTLAATDPDNDVSFFTVTTLPPASQGTLFYNGVPVQAGQTFTPEQAGQLVFNPNPNFVGNATFEYTATDSAGNTDATPATVTLPVQAAVTTAPPEAQDKKAPIRPNNQPSPVPTLTGTDPDGDVSFFTVTSIPTPQQGTLFYKGVPVQTGQTFTPDQAGELVFQPNPNFTGDVTFDYTVTDSVGNTDSSPAKVTLPVSGPSTTLPPEAIDRSGPIRPNNEPSPVPTLIGTDPDGDVSFFTVTSIPTPQQGTLFYKGVPVKPGDRFTPEQAGQLIFNPNPNFAGNVTFNYTVTDGVGNTDPTPATVTLPIQAAISSVPPVPQSVAKQPVPNNMPSPVTALSAFDPDGEVAFVQIRSIPTAAQGTLFYKGEPVKVGDRFTPDQARQLVFDPNPTFTGNVQFQFDAIDNGGNRSTNPGTVTIPVIGAAPTAPPVANSATRQPIAQGNNEPASVPTLMGSDPDGIVSFFTIQTPPSPEQGTLFLNGEPVVAGQLLTPEQASQLTFVPNPSFTGNATFTFTTTDERGNVSATPGVITLPVVGQTGGGTPQPDAGVPPFILPGILPTPGVNQTVSQVIETSSTLLFLGFDWGAILGIGSHLDCIDQPPEFYAPSEARVNYTIAEEDFFGTEQAELLRADHVNNRVYGYGGYDLIMAYQGDDTVFAGAGNDTAYGGRYHDILLGQEGFDLLFGDQDHDTIFGGPDDDHLYGGQQNDWLLGGLGNDTAIGDRDNDWVFGEEGYDSLMGHFNQDIIFGGLNSDTIHGGRGWDILFGGQHPDTVFGDLGNDTVHGNLGNDSLMGGMHRDWIYGDQNRDVVHAGQGHDVVFGGQDEDTVFGDRHNDTISGDDGDDSLMGNTCYDVMFGDRGNDTMHGGQQTDLMFGGQNEDSMFGDRGRDVVSGDRGFDILFGNLGGDFMFGGTERDTIFAGQEDDWAYGGQDSDLVSGDRGNDIVSGDRGSDYLLGNQDNDTIYGCTEADWIHGGQQNDVLYGGKDNDTLNGDRNNDVLFGDLDNDSLLGNQHLDILSGGAGKDILFGGQQEDTLYGNQGEDTLSGDLGKDILFGGEGIDVFVLRTRSAAHDIPSADIVGDFQLGVDWIGLTGGLTFVDVTLELLNNTTIVKITQTNQVLGIIHGVTPEQLIPALIPVDIGLV